MMEEATYMGRVFIMVDYVLGTTESIHSHNQRKARPKETNAGRWLWRVEGKQADRELLVFVEFAQLIWLHYKSTLFDLASSRHRLSTNCRLPNISSYFSTITYYYSIVLWFNWCYSPAELPIKYPMKQSNISVWNDKNQYYLISFNLKNQCRKERQSFSINFNSTCYRVCRISVNEDQYALKYRWNNQRAQILDR